MKAAPISALALGAALAAALVSGCATPSASSDRLPPASAPSSAATTTAASRTVTESAKPTATASPNATAPANPGAAAPARPAASSGSLTGAVSPCRGNADPQLILVVISQQRAWACSRTRQVYVTPVTTGDVATGDDTPTGAWQVQSKQTDRTLTLLNGTQYLVRYWMPYDDIYGFHDASWQTFPFGSPQYRTAGSHGCVHLPMAAMAWLYQWADIGATVTIRA